MNCQEVKGFSSDYLDGRLAPAEVLRLEEHMNSCAACARELAQLRATISLMSLLGGIDTSPDFLVQVNRKIDGGRNPSRFWRRLFEPMRIKLPLEAAALLLVSTLAFYLYQRSPELSEKSLVVPETKVEPLHKQPREREPEPRGEAPAAKPLPAPAAVAEQEMRSQEREVAARLKQESQATEVTGAGEGSAKPGARFSVQAGKPPPRAAAAPVEAERQVSRAKRAEATKAMSREYATLIPLPQVLDVVAEDVGGSQRRVKSLVEELGGKIVGERPSDDGMLLALELPQSRQAEFQSALKKEPAREISAFWDPPEPGSEDLPRAEGALRAGRSTLSEAKKSTQEKDEPTVKLEVRIRRKR